MTIASQIQTLQTQLNTATTTRNTADANIIAITKRLEKLRVLQKALADDAWLASIITVA